MKQCVVIANYVKNNYRKKLLLSHIDLFRSKGIDVILVAAEHIERYDGVSNYITAANVCSRAFVSRDIYSHTIAGNKKFFRINPYEKIDYYTYSVKMYQTVFNYCKNLGYEFAYFMEFDIIFKQEYINNLIDGKKDFSKIFFYPLYSDSNAFNTTFFFGNIKRLSDGFSDSRLDYLESLQKNKTIWGYEYAVFELFNDDKNVVRVAGNLEDMFEEFNLFSSANSADIYYDTDEKRYIFLFSKGDSLKNEFSCELLLDNDIIFSKTSSHSGYFMWFYLEFDRNYTIRYYDKNISESTLSRVKTVNTNSNNKTVLNFSRNHPE